MSAHDEAEPTLHNPGTLITPKEAIAKHTAGALLIDVRGPVTRSKQGLIDDAVVIDKTRIGEVLDPSGEQRLQRLNGDLDQEVVVFCGTEFGSDPVIDQLTAFGYRNVHQIAGGVSRWIVEGHPTNRA